MMYYGIEMNALNFGVKGHSSRPRWNNRLEPSLYRQGHQYSVSCVELDFLVEVCFHLFLDEKVIPVQE